MQLLERILSPFRQQIDSPVDVILDEDALGLRIEDAAAERIDLVVRRDDLTDVGGLP